MKQKPTYDELLQRIQELEHIAQGKNKLQHLVNNLPAGAVYVQDEKIYVNHGVTEILGYSAVELKTINDWFNILYPNNWEIIRSYYDSDKKAGFPKKRTVELVTKMGITKTVTFAAYSGDVGEIWILHDITGLKQALDKLRESESLVEFSLDITGAGVIDWNIVTGEIFFSDRWLEMAGYSHGELTPHLDTLTALVHPDDLPIALADLQEVLEGRKPKHSIEHRLLHKKGHWAWVQSSSMVLTRDDKGAPTRMIGTHIDITDRKQAEESLRQGEKQYRKVSELVSDWAYSFSIGPKGEIIQDWVTDAFFKTTGFSPEDFRTPIKWQEIIHPDDLDIVKDRMDKLYLKGQISKDEYRIKSKNGDWIWIRDYGEPVWNTTKDQIERIYGAAQVITESKQLDEQLKQSQKMQAIGTLAGGIAHEFNNLLGIIMGCTDMARDEVLQDSFAMAQLDNVMKASYRVKDLVKQILTFSHQSQQKKSPLNPCLLLKESLKLIQSSIPSSVNIKTNIATSCGNALVDPTEFQQIIMNLCSNAVWAMKEKGTIEVNLSQIHFDVKHATELGLSEGKHVELLFIDNGQGMDSATKSRIFDPFFTLKKVGEGTGMGLSIVYSIMESYGGTITVESKVGKGATFHLYFPVTDQFATEKTEHVSEIPRGTERILFVDDDEMFAEMGLKMISSLGYNVELMLDSKKALETFTNSPDNYDLIITDQIMPNLSGDELMKEIRGIRPNIPIILCTGYSTQMNEKKAKTLGINAFAFKPFARKDIAKLIRKVLDVS